MNSQFGAQNEWAISSVSQGAIMFQLEAADMRRGAPVIWLTRDLIRRGVRRNIKSSDSSHANAQDVILALHAPAAGGAFCSRILSANANSFASFLARYDAN
jgi:hypothetical protein